MKASRAPIRRRCRRPRVFDEKDTDDVCVAVMLVEDDHPAPGTKHEPQAVVTAALERSPELREVRERRNGALEPPFGVGRKAVSVDQPRESILGGRADDDASQRLTARRAGCLRLARI